MKQADRREATQAALIDAAIDSLVEKGWAATTAVEVCARAGVTRGALHHHYPSLAALLAAALRQLNVELLPTGPPPTDVAGLIDHTYRATCNPRFKAVIEAWLAMANDPSLRDELELAVVEFAKLVHPDQLRLRPAERKHYLLAREAILGLALGRATNGGRPLPHEGGVVTLLKAMSSDDLPRR